MTTKITVDVPAHNAWLVHAVVEEMKYDDRKAATNEWLVVEETDVRPGQKRDFWLTSYRRMSVSEMAIE